MEPRMSQTPLPKNPDDADQDQFLTILSREEAIARFEAALFPREIPSEPRRLSDAIGYARAGDILNVGPGLPPGMFAGQLVREEELLVMYTLAGANDAASTFTAAVAAVLRCWGHDRAAIY